MAKKEKKDNIFENDIAKRIESAHFDIKNLILMIGEYHLEAENSTLKFQTQKIFTEKISNEIQKIKQYAIKISAITNESLSDNSEKPTHTQIWISRPKFENNRFFVY